MAGWPMRYQQQLREKLQPARESPCAWRLATINTYFWHLQFKGSLKFAKLHMRLWKKCVICMYAYMCAHVPAGRQVGR